MCHGPKGRLGMSPLGAASFRILMLLALLGLIAVPVCAQDARLHDDTDSGEKAYAAGHYDEAEKFFSAALKTAQESGIEDERLATSLNDLAVLYYTQGKYEPAEPLYN